MNAHETLILNFNGTEDSVTAYGPRDAIRNGLRNAAMSLERPFSFEARRDISGQAISRYVGRIGRGYREIVVFLSPPGSYVIEDAKGTIDSPLVAANDWCLGCSTDVRIWPEHLSDPFLSFFEPAVLVRDLTLAGLTCVVDSGIGPGYPWTASDPQAREVLCLDPGTPGATGEIASAWADIVGPMLEVRRVPDLSDYVPLCSPWRRQQDADMLAEILLLFQEIAAATSANTPLLP
jgi:hypothetical protein